MSAIPSWSGRLRRARLGLAATVVVCVVAALVVALDAPAWVHAPLSALAALAALGFCLPRMRGREPVDGTLRIVGGAAILLVLLGLLLNVLPLGLSAAGWGIGVAVVEIVVVLLAARREPSPPVGRIRRRVVLLGRRRILTGAAWGVVTAAILTGALLLALGSYGRTHIAPVALGATTSHGTTVVTATSGSRRSGLEVRLVRDSGPTSTLARDVTVGPDEPAVSVRVPASTIGRIELVSPGSATPLRSIILDGTNATTGDG